MKPISKEYVEHELAQYKFPGMGIGVIKDGEVLQAEGFGFADLEKRTLIDKDTEWGIASCSKAFTATLLCMLAEDGYFGLEQPIREYLPDFQLYDETATKLCTVKDILCHRTGIGGYDALWVDECDRADIWRRLKYLKPDEPFRAAIQYSNLMYTMAGHIAEKVTGRSYPDLIRERIFEPLGMTRSNCSITDMLKSGNYASPYWQSDDGPVPIDNWNVDLGAPCGGINSTLSDMLKWLQFNIDDGVAPDGRRLISHESMTLLHTLHVRYELWQWDFPEVPPVGGYALGWYNDVYRGHFMYWHIGEIEGYGTMQFVLPREKLGIVVFNNIQKPDVLIEMSCVYEIIDNVLGLPKEDWSARIWAERNNYGHMLEDWRCDLMGESPRVEGTTPSHDLDAYCGKYFEPGHGYIEIFRADGAEGDSAGNNTAVGDSAAGRLAMRYRGVIQEMEHYHYDVFQVNHVKQDTLIYTCPLEFFTSADDGSIDRFAFRLYSQVDPIVFRRV